MCLLTILSCGNQVSVQRCIYFMQAEDTLSSIATRYLTNWLQVYPAVPDGHWVTTYKLLPVYLSWKRISSFKERVWTTIQFLSCNEFRARLSPLGRTCVSIAHRHNPHGRYHYDRLAQLWFLNPKVMHPDYSLTVTAFPTISVGHIYLARWDDSVRPLTMH